MITNFGVKNFYSFKEGLDISLNLNSNCPKKISNGKDIATILCFKGANGSGKTNALKILPLLKNICCHSFNLKPDDFFNFETFFLNEEFTEFYIDFIIDKIKYRYEIVLNISKIKSESLFRINKRITPIIKRKNNELIECIREFNELKIMKLRSNASLISTGNQYQILSIKPIYSFFSSILSNVSPLGLREIKFDSSKVTKIYHEDKKMFKFVKDIIKTCDLGIDNIMIKSRLNENSKKIYYPIFYHKTRNENKELLFFHQSSGTRTLYRDLIFYYQAIKNGSILILDEFDINFHPDILPRLLDLFTDPINNKKNAQFIFTTHNSKILNYMSKYRSYMINKDDNESYGYRLDEIPGDLLRNDRPIRPVYESGKIGGIPKL